MAEKVDVVIIGSGPGGSTAALYLARAGFHPIVLHGPTPGGQLTGTTDLENFPGWAGTGPDLVMKIEEQATAAGAEYRFEIVTEASKQMLIQHMRHVLLSLQQAQMQCILTYQMSNV